MWNEDTILDGGTGSLYTNMLAINDFEMRPAAAQSDLSAMLISRSPSGAPLPAQSGGADGMLVFDSLCLPGEMAV
jgi:hypothetical protein